MKYLFNINQFMRYLLHLLVKNNTFLEKKIIEKNGILNWGQWVYVVSKNSKHSYSNITLSHTFCIAHVFL